jgi:hypothetical protein
MSSKIIAQLARLEYRDALETLIRIEQDDRLDPFAKGILMVRQRKVYKQKQINYFGAKNLTKSIVLAQ